jgi:hypothetical protein
VSICYRTKRIREGERRVAGKGGLLVELMRKKEERRRKKEEMAISAKIRLNFEKCKI